MSIFKETFRDYVRDQLSIRDKIISRGNSGTGDGVNLPRRNQSNTVKLQSGKEITLDPGAFYSLFNRQCVIRMTSMTDYVEDVGLDIGINNEDGTRSNSTFSSIKGSALAQNFVLQGGVLSDFARNIKGERSVKRVTTPRDGFPRPGQKTNLSYGDGGIVSDATSDGYGIVPMPGIINANIRTKSAYGSLKEAKVNFVCHNQHQLEVLEMLYMRPGYAVLLEWGWSPYVDNDGKLINEFRTVEDEIGSELLFSNNVLQSDIYNSIFKLKSKSSSNYDGMLGYIKNFGFQARPDGGFDCFVELISAGEMLDSLTANSFNKFNPSPKENLTGESIKFEQLGIYSIIEQLTNISIDTTTLNSLDTAINFTQLYSPYAQIIKAQLWAVEKTLSAVGADQQSQTLSDNNPFNLSNRIKELNKLQSSAFEELIKTLGLENPQDLKNYYISGKDLDNSDNETFDWTSTTSKGYIRWDALVVLLNKQLIPSDNTLSRIINIAADRILLDPSPLSNNISAKIDPLLYVPFTDSDGLVDMSGDVNVCILPNQLEFISSETSEEIFGGNPPQISKWNPTYLAQIIQPSTNQNLNLRYENPNSPTKDGEVPDLTIEDQLRRIGSIFLSVDMLYNIYINNYKDETYTIAKFIQDIWNQVNQACPNHNFVLVDDKETPLTYVIDLGVSTPDLPESADLYEFTPFSNGNTLREFSYESRVPSSLSATIAINAQNPDNISNVEDVTYKAFNKSIKNRLIKNSELTPEQIKAQEDARISRLEQRINFEKRKKHLKQVLRGYSDNIWKNLKASAENEKIDPVSNAIKQFQAMVSQENDTQSTSSTIIPLTYNAAMDGISGIIIGNLFKIAPDRLPKAYRKSNIAFIVHQEEQSITAGQDWVTKIGGQLILLPIDSNNSGKLLTNKNSLFLVEGTFRNTTQTELNKPFVAESTEVDMSTAERQVQENLGIFQSPPPTPPVEKVRIELINQGYTIWEKDNNIYELYYKETPENGFEVKYIITKSGDNKGKIINYGNQPDISDKTKFDIEGKILSTPGSL